MAILGKEVDANFFNLIHQTVQRHQDRETDRRESSRQVFESFQRIALPRGAGVPPESEFFDVQCRDLCTAGFSFLFPFEPKFQRIVAAFGAPPNAIYLSAKITHCAEVLVYPSGVAIAEGEGEGAAPEEGGKPMFLVGCKFIERLYPSTVRRY